MRRTIPLVIVFCLLFHLCSFSQEDNSFAVKQVYSTKDFRFDIPKPWFYASPDLSQKKNQARCFLNSRLRMTAEGLFLVDAGKATDSIEKIIESMSNVMKNGKDHAEVKRDEIQLDGKKAVCLKTDVADFFVPCSVIVHERNGTLYLIMMSVSKKSHLEQRDLMLKTLSETWKWKESEAKK